MATDIQSRRDITPKEYSVAVLAFSRTLGGRSPRVSTFVQNGEFSLSAAVYTDWPCSERLFDVEANRFDEMLTNLSNKWASYKEQHRVRTIRKMALAIIKITAEQGERSDAALRADVFSADEVAQYGADACADADKIASNGPFAIKLAAKANAA